MTSLLLKVLLACAVTRFGQAAQKVNVSGKMPTLPSQERLIAVTSITTSSKMKITKFVQEYKKLPVYDTHITGQVAKNNPSKIIGNAKGVIYKDIEADIKSVNPKITPAAALNAAKKHHKDNDVLEESMTLMIYVTKGKAHLVYKVVYISIEGSSDTCPISFVDATTQRVLRTLSCESSAVKELRGYGGNSQIGRTEFTGASGKLGKLELEFSPNEPTRCFMESEHLKVYDLGGETFTRPHFFTYYRKNLRDKPPTDVDCKIDPIPDRPHKDAFNPANDMLYFGHNAVKMFKDMGFDKVYSQKLVALVNYHQEDFPDSEYQLYFLKFNDGGKTRWSDGRKTAYSLVSYAEAVAHEVAHSFTTQNSGLITQGEPGAINEAFSDIAGEMFKYQIFGSNDWVFVKGLYRDHPNDVERSLKDPRSVGSGIDHIDQWSPSVDVHDAAGIYSKAFYLLATTPGWDITKAFKIFAVANAVHWFRDMGFHQGACGVETAAKDEKFKVDDVTKAFSQVGVDCKKAPSS